MIVYMRVIKRKTKKTRKKKGGGKGRNKKLGQPKSKKKPTMKKKRTIRFSECKRDPECEGTKVCRGGICVDEHQVPRNLRTLSDRWELRHESNLAKKMNRESRTRERSYRDNIKRRIEAKILDEDRIRKTRGQPLLTDEEKANYNQRAMEFIERGLDRMRNENYGNLQRADVDRRRRQLAASGRSMAQPPTVSERPILRRTDSISDQITSSTSSSRGRSWDDIRRRLEGSTQRISGNEAPRMTASSATPTAPSSSTTTAATPSNITAEEWDDVADLLSDDDTDGTKESKQGGARRTRARRRRRKSRRKSRRRRRTRRR
jgi:hypothetical protein